MKKYMLGAALAAAMIAPGLANAEVSGSIDLGYESSDFDYGDFDSYSLGGTIINDMGGWTIQGDGRTTFQDWGSDYSHGYAAVHASTDLGGWDVGGFAGIINYYGDPATLFGAEARTAFGNFSVDGSASLFDADDNGWEGSALRIGGSYFFMPNFAINAGASQTDIDSSTDYEITEFSIGGAYQFANNVALTAGYTTTDGDRSPGASYDGDSLQLGVRFNFGGGSLQDNTNDGAWGSATHVSDTLMRW